ncbi:MAG TPA: M20 family metallopeptidase [Gemmatimonadaceae bacterium]
MTRVQPPSANNPPTTNSPAAAIDAPPAVVAQFEGSEVDALVALRHDLHRHPELSWQEERTATRLEASLASLGIDEMRRVAGTGLVARLPGRERGGAPVALRGDIDALPVHEDTGLPFASEVPGVMHACGHDVHATWTVGAAMLLRRVPARRDVLLVFQPAEEVGAGAAAILASGVLDGVSHIFGGHVDRRFPIGTVVTDAGPLAASADTFTIELHGRGAHGARPHESADPIVGAAALVTALQTVVSRRIDPAAPAVVTVGSIHGGTAPNVIPGQVTLTGTVRTLLPEVRTRVHDAVRHLAQSIAAAYDLTAHVTLDHGTPPLVNPTTGAALAREAATRVLGAEQVVPFGVTNLAGEDFACYLEQMDGCFLRIGAREPGGEPMPAHSPKFMVADGAILVGAAVLAECARVAAEL